MNYFFAQTNENCDEFAPATQKEKSDYVSYNLFSADVKRKCIENYAVYRAQRLFFYFLIEH